jgi:hypothetical protein
MCVGVVLTGCANEDDHAGYFNGGAGGENGGVIDGPCREDAERECGYKIGDGEDNVTCYRGVQTCNNGLWSECKEGTTVTLPKPEDQSFFSGASDYDVQGTAHTGGTGSVCSPTDLCDPRCYELNESTPTFTAAYSLNNSVLCPTTTSLTECAAGAGCAHSLCTTGVALSTSACGTCVTNVCAALPACCLTTWDQTCIDKALSICNNSPPPLGLCDFGIFSETTLTTANQPNLGSDATVGAVGDIIIDTDASGAFPNSVVTQGDIWIKNANQSTAAAAGGIWAAGGLAIDASSTTWTTDVHVGTGAYLNSGNKITGTVWSAGNYSVGFSPSNPTPTTSTTATGCGSGCNLASQNNTSTATNTKLAGTKGTDFGVTSSNSTGLGTTPPTGVPVPTINIPTAVPTSAATCPATTAFTTTPPTGTTITGSTPSQTATIDGGVFSLAPGNYGTIVLRNSAKLVLSAAGSYTFTAINGANANGGGIQVQTTTGTSTVTVCGSRWGTTPTSLPTPHRLRIHRARP